MSFFFKQKTAYDMRISDWSSDVCSSDLIGALRHVGDRHGDQLLGLARERPLAEHGLAEFAESGLRLGRQLAARVGELPRQLRIRRVSHEPSSEERRVGKAYVSTCRSWRSPSQ